MNDINVDIIRKCATYHLTVDETVDELNRLSPETYTAKDVLSAAKKNGVEFHPEGRRRIVEIDAKEAINNANG